MLLLSNTNKCNSIFSQCQTSRKHYQTWSLVFIYLYINFRRFEYCLLNISWSRLISILPLWISQFLIEKSSISQRTDPLSVTPGHAAMFYILFARRQMRTGRTKKMTFEIWSAFVHTKRRSRFSILSAMGYFYFIPQTLNPVKRFAFLRCTLLCVQRRKGICACTQTQNLLLHFDNRQR